MAKTIKHTFEQIVSFENLLAAWRRTSRGRRAQHNVIEFQANLEPNLLELQGALMRKTYRTGPYRRFHIYEPKRREISSLPLKDRVVQHALMAAIEPVFEARMIDQSFACRVGKGAHMGANVAQGYMRRTLRQHGAAFALKADISKYFPSVCHDPLKRLMRRRIACRDTLWLIDDIIDSGGDADALMPRGIPIGNLASQLFANVYLGELDQFVKSDLRERHYARYMDDFVITHHDKAHLHEVRREVEAFLWASLGLRTNSKTQVFPLSGRGARALDFLGYRIRPTHRSLRKDSVNRMKKKMKRMARDYRAGEIGWREIDPVVMSWVAHARHADTFNLRRKVVGGTAFVAPPREGAAREAKIRGRGT